MSGYLHLFPEFVLLFGATVALFGEFLPGRDRTVALLGAGISTVAALASLFTAAEGTLFGGMLVYDTHSQFVRAGICGLTALWLLWLAGRGMTGERSREATALALFSSLGGVLVAASAEFITMFMALELSTMPAYVLMGYRRDDIRGLEGALKYFFLSMLTSLIMLYGLSFLYGLSGSTLFAEVAPALEGAGTLALAGAVLVMAGLFAKMSAAPFHFWAPDAYAGAPAASVAFVSTVPKIAGAAVLVRLATMLAPGVDQLATLFVIGALASMLLGNLAALPQSDVRRLMAYSGVAHTGYLLLGLAAGVSINAPAGDLAMLAVLLYAVAYSVPSMAIMLVVAEEGDSVASLANLASRRPWAAWAMVVWLVSLIGIPPLAGFFGKLYLFGAGVTAGYEWLVVIAVLVSVVSAGYYFRIVRSMFFGTESTEADSGGITPAASGIQLVPSRLAAAALLIAVAATFAIGLAGSPILRYLGYAG